MSPDERGPITRIKDGRAWRIGSNADIAWIQDRTSLDTTITVAIPPVFEAYATLELPATGASAENAWVGDEQNRHDHALPALLRAEAAAAQPWWLGYLDTGADDTVFPDAPVVTLYGEWQYVLVEAGPQQAATWRREDEGSFWRGTLPNLMYPADRSWLVSTLWDDDWTCIGGSEMLVNDLMRDAELGPRARRVSLGEDATPPGHHAA